MFSMFCFERKNILNRLKPSEYFRKNKRIKIRLARVNFSKTNISFKKTSESDSIIVPSDLQLELVEMKKKIKLSEKLFVTKQPDKLYRCTRLVGFVV